MSCLDRMQKPFFRILIGLALWSTLFCGLAPLIVHSATYQVTSPADSGGGTLRQALLNASPNDTITFHPDVFPIHNPTTINVRSALPTIGKNGLTIDASNAGVILDGSQVQGGANGLRIAADDCTVMGLTIRRFPENGILLESTASGNVIGGDRTAGAGPNGQGNLIVFNRTTGIAILGDGNDVRGNYIGIDGTGWWDWGNILNGIAVWQGAKNNIIGGTNSAYRNVIGGNDQNGVWIYGSETQSNQVIGNYIGTRADGMGPVSNGLCGVAIQGGASQNWVGSTTAGAGNLISGNGDGGIYISDVGSDGNWILRNKIGTDYLGTGIIGQTHYGVIVHGGASNNRIGDGTPAGRNVIGGNADQGVLIAGSGTTSNRVQGNYIGTNVDGTAALPNGLHGVELSDGAHHNTVGGNRLLGEGNLLSGNRNHGLVILSNANYNTVSGNVIGPDATGTHSLGYHPFGGIDIANGAHHNLIGGLGAGQGNLISGNQTDGIALFTSEGSDPTDNQVLGNLIGTALDGSTPLPNGGYGILNAEAQRTRIEGNTIAYNESYGILVAACHGNLITQNSFFGNTLSAISAVQTCIVAPQITDFSLGSTETITGTTEPNVRVEIFAAVDEEGKVYEGYTTADPSGNFVFSKVGGFAGPNVTAASIQADNDTSEFSKPVHLAWTMLLYLSGDNDLEEVVLEVADSIAAAGPSPRANVLALVDGYTTTARSGTVLYDLTWGEKTVVSVPWNTGELNMGDGQTLVDFVAWGRETFPSRYTLLSIVDHGGGWASSDASISAEGSALARRRRWMSGGSGLSWDFSDGYDYLESTELHEAMALISNGGADPLDVLFYDVCLMGMVEVGYQIKDDADFFVSSQNIGWAPMGSQNRYVQAIHLFNPTADPRQMAEFLVQVYDDANPVKDHPFTVSAIDLSRMGAVLTRVDQLATSISQTLTSHEQTDLLHTVYTESQKIDYDSDFRIEPETDGFVDLYDLALQVTQLYTDSNVIAAAQALMTELDSTILAEAHYSGHPWMAPSYEWNLDHVHGLSIFMPLGEDLELSVLITDTLGITRNLRLRDMYSDKELLFVADSAWDSLIDKYYQVVASPVPTDTADGPAGGLLMPDVMPPTTTITITGVLRKGQQIWVSWSTVDEQTGADGAELWLRVAEGWTNTGQVQTGNSGTFVAVLPETGYIRVAVRASDKAGNIEAIAKGTNVAVLDVCCRTCLPLAMQAYSSTH